jgi:tetratricopeptide (TPR) repeat protein
MPRWLSEGISVYEERQANKTWGQTMTPRYREILLGDSLVPLSKLSGAFLSPPSPLHLQFAYYESSLAVEFLIEKHGLATLKRVLVDLGAGMPINESIARYAGSLDAVDAAFAEWARAKAKQLAPQADWSQPELPRRATSEMIAAWLKEHPSNYAALGRLARQQMNEGKLEAARGTLEQMLKLYPEDDSADGPLVMLAELERERKDQAAERAALENVLEFSDDDVESLSRLVDLASEAKDWQLVRKSAERWLAINPLMAAPHRALAQAAEELDDNELAVNSNRAQLLLEPFDPADIHLKLATALEKRGELAAAKRHALLALDETPRFREAYGRLLAIVKKMEQNETKEPEVGRSTAPPQGVGAAKEPK